MCKRGVSDEEQYDGVKECFHGIPSQFEQNELIILAIGIYVSKYVPKTGRQSTMFRITTLTIIFFYLATGFSCFADRMIHLRNGAREWDTFAEKPEANALKHSFVVDSENPPRCLSFRQIDVKQSWRIAINDHDLGRLTRDENDMTVFFKIPDDVLREGANEFTLTQTNPSNRDDIYFGYLAFHTEELSSLLSQCKVRLRITPNSSRQTMPGRLTILDQNGSLFTTGNQSDATTAVRPGVVYTSTGDVVVSLPEGRYSITAGRGVEWSINTQVVNLKTDKFDTYSFPLSKEVDTAGYISCDTHVHTFTHSRHGDATLDERLVTIAGEGIQLPIATDHNLHINYETRANELGLRHHFTPVVGNEVTTKVGHFNIFPVSPRSPLPDHTLTNWAEIVESIKKTTGAQIIILNHARDVHTGVTPFGPARHNSLTAYSQINGPFVANAMELINSGATQTDVMQLYRDWFGLLNSGIHVTGIGCSDSHDVARHFIGQGRTYIRGDSSDPAAIDVPKAVTSLLAGKTNVSYGLFTTMTVNNKFEVGDLATGNENYTAHIKVQGPSWVQAKTVTLYVNGHEYETFAITDNQNPGVKWIGSVPLGDLTHDSFVVAIAQGDGVRSLHWPTAKPYQPDSPHFTPYTLGSTGAIQIDIDGDGKFRPARDYAEKLAKTTTDIDNLISQLNEYDRAVAIHAANLLHQSGTNLSSDDVQLPLKKADTQVRHGFSLFQRSLIR